MALLDYVQQACGEIGLDQPTQIFGNTDQQAIQFLALAQREGRDFWQLARRQGGWQELHKEYTFTVAGGLSGLGSTVQGSATITMTAPVAGIAVGWAIAGVGIPLQAFVVSILSNIITINLPCTLTTTNETITFGQIAYPLPADFGYFITQTWWDGSYRWQLLGPLEAQEKQVIKWGISPVGPRRRFWIEQNKFFINPTPTNFTDVIAYDYYSNGFCDSATGVAQSAWAADTDVYNLDVDSFVLGLKWRFLRAKGMDYSQEMKDYELQVQRVQARNGGNRDLPINSQSRRLRLLSDANVPDTGFGTTT